jgi:histidyl-tRNA synthetase
MVIARSLRGMNDLFAADLNSFHQIEKAIAQVFAVYGYEEIRTPILEELALFKRGIGETTDIVEKEMFLVEDGEHVYCLRPENTAPVVRALIERGGISEDSLEKLYYVGPMFRKERPQRGRLRQFHQFGIELFGVSEPSGDIEIVVMVDHLIKTLGLTNIRLKINSLGTVDERHRYKDLLRKFLSDKYSMLCEDCKRRIIANPLRILDCKNDSCREISKQAPKIIECLDQDSHTHFQEVTAGLLGEGISFELDPYLVRGLDYYNRTVFEFVSDEGLGAQNTVAGGGRYDGLFLTLGNKIDLPAIGCAGGIERIALLLQHDQAKAQMIQIALVGADPPGQKLAMKLAFALRKLGISADFSLTPKSLKAQMRRANKLNAQFVAVLGEQEINNNRISLKGLINKTNHEMPLDAQSVAKFLNPDV